MQFADLRMAHVTGARGPITDIGTPPPRCRIVHFANVVHRRSLPDADRHRRPRLAEGHRPRRRWRRPNRRGADARRGLRTTAAADYGPARNSETRARARAFDARQSRHLPTTKVGTPS